MEPRLPSIGMAFIRTPPAPSVGSISGGGWSTIWPVGISGSSARPPRSVVLNRSPRSLPLPAGEHRVHELAQLPSAGRGVHREEHLDVAVRVFDPGGDHVATARERPAEAVRRFPGE